MSSKVDDGVALGLEGALERYALRVIDSGLVEAGNDVLSAS